MSTTLKFVLLVIGAALLALTARTLFANMTNRQKPVEISVQVRVAASDLPAGLLLRNEDLAWKPLAQSNVPEGALVKGTPGAQATTGVLVRHDTKAGAFVLERDIIRPDAPGFLAAVLKPGMRAVSVPVDNVSGNAGLIQPGDYVDMILVQQSRKNEDLNSERARSVVSETVVEKVRVIAVGSVFEHQPKVADKHNSSQIARTVTIEVTPRAAEAVTVASRLGTLSMALRSFALADRNAPHTESVESVVAWDGEKKSAPVWAGDVSRAIGAARAPEVVVKAPVPKAAPHEITIYRGSKKDQLTLGGAR